MKLRWVTASLLLLVPPLHAEEPAFGLVFDHAWLRDLPGSPDVWSRIETVETQLVADRTDGPGLFTGEPARLGGRGSWTQTSYTQDGLDVTRPFRVGTPFGYPATGGLDSVVVRDAAFPVEVGPPGPSITLVPRPAGASWDGTAEVAALPHGLQANGIRRSPSIARFGSWSHASLSAQGPLRRDRAALALAAALTDSGRLERSETLEREARAARVAARLLLTPSSGDRVTVHGQVHRLERAPFARTAADGDVEERDTASGVGVSWERPLGAWSVAARAAYQHASIQTNGFETVRVVERLLDGPVGALALSLDGTESAWETSIRAGRTTGRHRPRAGFEVRGLRARPEVPGAATFAELVDGRSARVWEYTAAGAAPVWSATEVAFFAAHQAAWLGERLTIDGGLRVDAAGASSRARPGAVSWSAFSPRVFGRGVLIRDRLAVFAGYAGYRHRLPLGLLAFGDPDAPSADVYRWQDRNGDGRYQPGEGGALIAREGPGGPVASIDPDLKPPTTAEVTAGIEGRLGRVHLRFAGVRRDESDLVESVNVGLGPDDWTAIGVPDDGGDIIGTSDDQILPVFARAPASFGRDRFLLTNPEGHTAYHEGVELTIGVTTGRLRLRVAGSAARTVGQAANRGFHVGENDHGIVGELFDQPNADTLASGRHYFDRAYTIKIAATYQAPGDVRLGLVARYQDGQPLARWVIAPNLPQGPEAVRAIFNGRSRFTFTETTDVRIEKGFTLRGTRLAAAVSVFNLLNNGLEFEEDVRTGAGYRDITAVQSPRAFTLGLRWDF